MIARRTGRIVPAPPTSGGWLLDLALVLLLAVLVAGSDLTWAARDAGPPMSDAGTHAFYSLDFHDQLDRGGAALPLRALLRLAGFQNHYPPLVYQVGEVGWFLLDRSLLAPVLGLAPFVLLLAVSAYGLGRLMAGRLAGLTAATMVCTAPVVLDHSRMPYLDMPLAALVAFGTWMLLASRSFERLGPSRGWGLALGLGLLTKWTFLGFLAVPWLVATVTALRRRGTQGLSRAAGMLLVGVVLGAVAVLCFPLQSSGHLAVWVLALLAAVLQVARLRRGLEPGMALVNASEALVLALALAAPYYCASREQVLHKVVYQMAVQVDFARTLHANLAEQSLWLGLTAPWWPLGVLLGLARRGTRLMSLQLLGSVALNTVLCALIPHDPRYLMPNLPALVALSVNVVRGVPGMGVAVLMASLAMGAVQAGSHLPGLMVDWPTLQAWRGSTTFQMPWRPPLPLPPRTAPYPFEALLDSLEWQAPGPTATAIVAGSAEESVFLQPRALLYYALLKRRRLVVWELGHRDPAELPTGPVTDYLLLYRHPQAPGQELPPRARGVPTTRQALLERAVQLGAFPQGLRTVRIFRFDDTIAVELLRRPRPGPPTGSAAVPAAAASAGGAQASSSTAGRWR